MDEVWTIQCSTTGSKAFSFDNAIALTDPHLEDGNPANNDASTPYQVEVVPPVTDADVKITGQALVSPPSEIDVSQNVDVTLRKTLHNNGPFGPVDVSINAQAVASGGLHGHAQSHQPHLGHSSHQHGSDRGRGLDHPLRLAQHS